MPPQLGKEELRADIWLQTEGASDMNPEIRLGFEYGAVGSVLCEKSCGEARLPCVRDRPEGRNWCWGKGQVKCEEGLVTVTTIN